MPRRGHAGGRNIVSSRIILDAAQCETIQQFSGGVSHLWSDQPDPLKHAQVVEELRSKAPIHKPAALAQTISLDITVEPEALAKELHAEPGFIWLDDEVGRHHMFHDPLCIISCDGEQAHVQGTCGSAHFACGSFGLLQAAVEAWAGVPGARLVGYIAYECGGEIEDLGSSDTDGGTWPHLWFALYDRRVTAEGERWSLTGTEAWRGEGSVRNAASDFARWLDARKGPMQVTSHDTEKPLSPGPLESDPEAAAFKESVADLVNRILRGDFFQVNFCRHLQAPLEVPLAWPLFQRMRARAGGRFRAFLHLDDKRSILSVSPELYLRVRAGKVESKPIKGTRPRGKSHEEDEALRRDLSSSEKDRAELSMIVDVVRNDLSRVCLAGSVKVEEHATVLTLPSLHHTVSRVSGTLRPDVGLVDLLRASFPAASITGAPKIAAMKAVHELERQKRGPCMGAIGWISLTGEMELSVAIRTAFTDAGKVIYLAGCGITSDSQPVQELRESQAKAKSFVNSLGLLDE